MTPEEVAADLNQKSSNILYSTPGYGRLAHADVLHLMNEAAMQGFKLGSNVALSMVKGALLVQLEINKSKEGK